MKVYNQDKTEELANYDLTLGYLAEDKRVIGRRKSLIEEIKNKDGSISTTVYPTLDITEDCFVYIPFTPKELMENEMADLKYWFNNYYTIQEQKLRRLETLNILTDNGEIPHDALLNLYNEAETKRSRIQELEVLINR